MGFSSGLRNNWPPSGASRQIPGSRGILTSESPGTHFSSSPDDMTPELRVPVSTIAGRSGFFATPNSRQSIEVQLPLISPRVRAEYHQVSDAHGSRSSVRASGLSRSGSVAPKGGFRTRKDGQATQQPAVASNLNRFIYSGCGSSTVGHEHRRQLKKPPKTGRVAKPAHTGKKPRVRGARDERMRDRSSFARAVQHFRRRTGNA